MSEEGDNNVVHVEFGNPREKEDDPLVVLEAEWTVLDDIIKRHLVNQGLELSLRRLKRIEDM